MSRREVQQCAKNAPISTSRNDKGGNWKSEARRKIYRWQKLSDVPLMRIWRGMTRLIPHIPRPQQGMLFIPRMNDGGFQANLDVSNSHSSHTYVCRLHRCTFA